MSKDATEANTPPRPPDDLGGLATEMLRCVSNTQHHQGMLRYWLMWRMPHLLDNIRTTPGIKLHYCSASLSSLVADFPQLMLLSDLLVVGQCGNVLLPEWLCLERPIGQAWPSIDGVKDGISVMFGKEDRPVPDGVLPFLFGDFSAFAPLGRVAYLPLSTLLSGWHPSEPPPEAAVEHLKMAVSRARSDGLPTGTRLEDLQERAKQLFAKGDQKSVNMEDLMTPEEKKQLPRSETGVRYYSGRRVYPDTPIDQPDPRWTPADILAWELVVNCIS